MSSPTFPSVTAALRPSFLGRTLADAERFFGFEAAALRAGALLEVGAGAGSVVAEAARQGLEAVAVDPLYARPHAALRVLGESDLQDLRLGRPAAEREDPALAGHQTALRRFLEDYPGGRAAARYLGAALPDLPLRNHRFDLVLCGGTLFGPGAGPRLSPTALTAALRELVRVARGEVRVGPVPEDLEDAPEYGFGRVRAVLTHLGVRLTLRRNADGERLLVLHRDLPFT